MLELHEPFWILVCLYSYSSLLWAIVCEFHLLIFLVMFLLLAFLLLFQAHILNTLQARILDAILQGYPLLLTLLMLLFFQDWSSSSPLVATRSSPLPPPLFHSYLVQQVEPHHNMPLYLHSTSWSLFNLSNLSSFWPSLCTCVFDIYNSIWVCRQVSTNLLL